MENRTKKNVICFKRQSMAAAAALALFVCISGTTVLAATGNLEGFFTDVFGWNGAVVGTAYAQASDEVALRAVREEGKLLVELKLRYPGKVPYSELEMLGIGRYEILDEENNVITEGAATDLAAIAGGTAVVSIPLEALPEGTYRLSVSNLVGGKKADQFLTLQGIWECPFAG